MKYLRKVILHFVTPEGVCLFPFLSILLFSGMLSPSLDAAVKSVVPMTLGYWFCFMFWTTVVLPTFKNCLLNRQYSEHIWMRTYQAGMR